MKIKKITPKILFILSFQLLFACICYAQSTGVVSYKETTLYSQEFKHMIKTSDGGILGVSSLGYGGRVCKIDASFNQVWSSGIDSVVFIDAIETNDGNYVLLGLALTYDYNGAVHIIKVNPAGTVLFNKMYYSNIVNQLTADGICKGAGTDQGFVFFGGNCIAMHYLIKCDVNGNIEWTQAHAGFGNGAYVSMLAEATGYVGCFNYLAPTGSCGISKIDLLGNVTAIKLYESATQVAMFRHSLVKKNNGDYYLWSSAGDVYGLQNYTISNNLSTATCKRQVSASQIYVTSVMACGNGTDDILISSSNGSGYAGFIKLNSSDNIVYQKQANTFPSAFNTIIPMATGTYAFGGNAGSYGKTIAVVDETGTGVCTTSNTSLTTSSYTFTTTTPTITNYTVPALVMTGMFPLFPVVQTKTTICGALEVGETALTELEINAYPNPTNGSTQIDFNSPSNEMVNLQIMDVTGQIVKQEKQKVFEGDSHILLDLSGLSDGVYTLTMKFEDSSLKAVKKLIKFGN